MLAIWVGEDRPSTRTVCKQAPPGISRRPRQLGPWGAGSGSVAPGHALRGCGRGAPDHTVCGNWADCRHQRQTHVLGSPAPPVAAAGPAQRQAAGLRTRRLWPQLPLQRLERRVVEGAPRTFKFSLNSAKAHTCLPFTRFTHRTAREGRLHTHLHQMHAYASCEIIRTQKHPLPGSR